MDSRRDKLQEIFFFISRRVSQKAVSKLFGYEKWSAQGGRIAIRQITRNTLLAREIWFPKPSCRCENFRDAHSRFDCSGIMQQIWHPAGERGRRGQDPYMWHRLLGTGWKQNWEVEERRSRRNHSRIDSSLPLESASKWIPVEDLGFGGVDERWRRRADARDPGANAPVNPPLPTKLKRKPRTPIDSARCYRI